MLNKDMVYSPQSKETASQLLWGLSYTDAKQVIGIVKNQKHSSS